jgi:hypothetical protein
LPQQATPIEEKDLLCVMARVEHFADRPLSQALCVHSETGRLKMSHLTGEQRGLHAEDSSVVCCKPDEYKHLQPIRSSGVRPPLFCIFPSPPGAREFVDILPNDQPVYDFYFSRLDSASNFPTVEQLAGAFIQDLRKVQAHGPYQLCGYSKAGLVAYEMARLLEGQGEDVPFLALFETWHPRYERNLTYLEFAHFKLSYFLDRLKKYGRDLFQGSFHDVAGRVAVGVV